jgi:ERCC4-type nuclease
VLGDDPIESGELRIKLINEIGRDNQLTMTQLKNAMLNLSDAGKSNIYSFSRKAATKEYVAHKDYAALKNNKSQDQLYHEAANLDPSSIKFKNHIRKSLSIVVDHREPDELFTLLDRSQIDSVDIAQMPLGDIFVTDGKSELIFERKTITDFDVSIRGDDHRAHSQVERYYEYQQSMARKGVAVRFIWIIEGENEGARGLYHGLPEIKQMDGMINYITGISDQYLVSTYNLTHTAYLITKLIQGYFERELTYKVRIHDSRVDKKHDRVLMDVPESTQDRGVTRKVDGLAPMLSYIPGISSNVAKELAATGKSFAEIVQMNREELLAIKGVGAGKADIIIASFGLRG